MTTKACPYCSVLTKDDYKTKLKHLKSKHPEIYKIVKEVVKIIPGKNLGIHAHNDTDNAVANTLAAINAGVRHAQGTLNGLGEASLVIDNLMSRDTLEVAIGVVGLYEDGPVVLTNPKKNFLQELAADAPSNSLLQCEPWLLQEGVLVPALGIRGDEESNVLVMDFSHDANQVANAISSGEYQIGFLMRAVPLNVLEGVVRDGAVLPPKSTYFAPKLLTGVVFNLLD